MTLHFFLTRSSLPGDLFTAAAAAAAAAAAGGWGVGQGGSVGWLEGYVAESDIAGRFFFES